MCSCDGNHLCDHHKKQQALVWKLADAASRWASLSTVRPPYVPRQMVLPLKEES